MTKLKKIYYIPGIISLVGIWLFYFYFQKRFTVRPEGVLRFIVPKDHSNNENEYSVNNLVKELEKRKAIPIELDGDAKTNEKKFELILFESRKLIYTKDTATYLDIRLGKECKYAELVRLIDLCRQDDHKTYTLFRNRFIILIYPPEPIDTTKKIEPLYL